jgi:hypothetical protein
MERKENVDGKNEIRTVDDTLCSRNSVGRGIIFNGAIDAILYTNDHGNGTEAIRRDTGLGKCNE